LPTHSYWPIILDSLTTPLVVIFLVSYRFGLVLEEVGQLERRSEGLYDKSV